MDLKNAMVRMFVVKAIAYGLKQLKNFMNAQDFKEIRVVVLDKVRNYFKEESFADDVAEMVCDEVEEYFSYLNA